MREAGLRIVQSNGRKFLKISKILMLLGIALASSGASAEAYIGGGLGFGLSNAADKLDSAFGYTSTDKKDTRRSAYTAYGGYALNKSLAFEVAYVDFGKYEISGKIGATNSADAVQAAAVSFGVVTPISLGPQFGIDLKLGLGAMTQKYHCITVCTWLPDTSKTTAVGVIGGGMYWTLSNSVTLRGRYEYYGGGKFTIKDSFNGVSADYKANFSLLSAAVEYHF